MPDAKLLPFCSSPRESALVQACIDEGSITKGALKVGINRSQAHDWLNRVRHRASIRGYSPNHDMTHPAPESHVVKGVSTLYGPDGQVQAQWVKTDLKADCRIKAIQDALAEITAEYKGVAKPIKPPSRTTDHILTVYPMGDPHIGMYAWAEECGEDFDTNIARADLLAAVSRLTHVAPSSDKALIINLGDFFHADSTANSTLRSHAQLDVDTRWPKVLKAGCMVMVDLIGLALKKHAEVEVINAIGNHDDHSSIMLAAFLEAFFHNEPRVTIRPTVGKFHYVEFGRNLIGVTHGDTVKLPELSSLMATDQPDGWGRTEHRYWYTGHIHHTSKIEQRGCVVESFRTLAAKDSWHTANGYRSGRDMYAIVLDKEHGEVERYRCDIRMARR